MNSDSARARIKKCIRSQEARMNRYDDVDSRAGTIAKHGSLAKVLAGGYLQQFQDVSVSETLVLGLLNQGVRKYIGILGHGNTDID